MFKNFRKNNSDKILIEFGSDIFKLYVPSIGLFKTMPSVICTNNNYDDVIFIGEDAKNKYSNRKYKKIHPVIDGSIYDYKASELFLHHELTDVLKLMNRKTKFLRPNIVASIHSTSSEVEISAYTDALESFGVSSVIFVNEGVAALYSNTKISNGIICKIGYSITDLLIVFNDEVTYDNTLSFGSSDIVSDLQNYIKDKYRLDLSAKTINDLIYSIDISSSKKKTLTLKGKNLNDGQPVSIDISQAELVQVILESFSVITTELKKIIENVTTAQLDVLIEGGISVSGGLTIKKEFIKQIKSCVKLNVSPINPLKATVEGLNHISNSPNLLESLEVKDLIFL